MEAFPHNTVSNVSVSRSPSPVRRAESAMQTDDKRADFEGMQVEAVDVPYIEGMREAEVCQSISADMPRPLRPQITVDTEGMHETPFLRQAFHSRRTAQLVHMTIARMAYHLKHADEAESSVFPLSLPGGSGSEKAEQPPVAQPEPRIVLTAKRKRRLAESELPPATKTHIDESSIKTRDCDGELSAKDREDIAFSRCIPVAAMQEFADLLNNGIKNFDRVSDTVFALAEVPVEEWGKDGDACDYQAFSVWPYVMHPALPGLLMKAKDSVSMFAIVCNIETIMRHIRNRNMPDLERKLVHIRTRLLSMVVCVPVEDLIIQRNQVLSQWTEEHRLLKALCNKQDLAFFVDQQNMGKLQVLARRLKANIQASSEDPRERKLEPENRGGGWFVTVKGFQSEVVMSFSDYGSAQAFASVMDDYLDSIIKSEFEKIHFYNDILGGVEKGFVDMNDMLKVLYDINDSVD